MIVELGLVAFAVAVVAGALLSVLKHRYDGRFRGLSPRHANESAAATDARAVLGDPRFGELAARATLVQFSSAFCAPCRATHRILTDVSAMVAGVRHVEIDAESNLDLVRRLGIVRTPTVLVLDAAGTVVTRASGQPRKADVIAAIGKAVGDHPAVPAERSA